MKEFKISLDRIYQEITPDTEESEKIRGRIASSIITMRPDNLESIMGFVGKFGHSFCPATFHDGKYGRDSFAQTQLLVLDIKKSLGDVRLKAEEYNLPILFGYGIASSDQESSRVAFLFDIPLVDIRAAEIAKSLLLTIFPEADQSSKDVTKIYFGHTYLSTLYVDKKMPKVDIEALTRTMTVYLRERYEANHYKERIARFARENGIALNKNKLLDISLIDNSAEQSSDPPSSLDDSDGKISPSSFIIIKASGDFFPNRSYRIILDDRSGSHRSSSDPKSLKNHSLYRSDVLNDIRANCRLFREFEDGTCKLTLNERLAVASNMIHVETGSKRFNEILS
jgi:hypothetical protein